MCRWRSPAKIRKLQPLEEIFKATAEDGQLSQLSSLFHHTLEVPDVSWEDLLDELQYLSDSGISDQAAATDIYRHLYTLIGEDNKTAIRSEFDMAAPFHAYEADNPIDAALKAMH